MSRLVFLCALLGFGLLAGEAHADANENDWDGGYKIVATRRSGFVAGISLGLAAGKSRDQLWPQVKVRIDALGGTYAKVGSVVTAVSELESIDGKELVGTYHPDEIGVGVAQGPHPEIGEHAIWLVVLLAEKR